MQTKIEQIQTLLDQNKVDEASQLLEQSLKIAPHSAGLQYQKGQIHLKRQEWGKAINAFNRVLEIDAHFPGAQNQIDMVRSILGFFNPDLINP
ncbi:lipopolysaccharide assembly protein LapB [Mangrovibacterium marinum]|uniref:Tetratricopeptide repeat protein n=1 Tax=Mangrovibacterium marinum TaxID=1639118 RepID=A0A2T5C328_9BACT|nr:tetratricopeptide repeat protein [Mangrovibacterium marinum]PTN09171.1 tetratricopeptide repeat protein [Mangrovibacterium marinum]